MTRPRRDSRLLIALVLLATSLPAHAAETLQVIVFPGGFNWPIWAAQQKGLFAREALDVKLTPTPSSVFQLTGLIEGKFDIGVTAIGNVIAYPLAPVGGFEPNCSLDVEGMRTMLSLRSEYGRPQRTLTDPAACHDLSYYQKAVGALR